MANPSKASPRSQISDGAEVSSDKSNKQRKENYGNKKNDKEKVNGCRNFEEALWLQIECNQ
jgi:hypothetical protein